MHIPPYHKKAIWQRFFVGALIGAVIAYCVFAYMYNTMYERLLENNLELKSQVTDLKNQNDALLKDKKDLDEKNKKELTVESIEVTVTNAKNLKLDHLTAHQMEDIIKAEINQIIGQEVRIIDESSELLTSTIENKEFAINDFTYSFTVTKIAITQTVKIEVEAKTSS
ncbi:sporulation membrane protein YtrI [Virgibacillus dakarensis]|uniref:sporulation membrane protein YtrI n=1 Tax=Virgibacillus dakarensis TaxID=1917889 RepID=UPI000B4415B6|nr:sporulation membrane protein YtrI [Virgibacillus dakarensis]